MSPHVDAETQARREREAKEDLELVQRARNGERSAFGQLVERHQKKVYSVAFGILRNRDDAWDVAQEAFVKAYRNLERFEGTSAFYTWIYRIAYNLAIDTYRSKGRRDAVHFEDQTAMESVLENEDKPTFNIDPAEMSDRAELMKVLNEAIQKLSDKHRAIIVLREIEGLSYEEISQVLGIAKGTVMSRLFHARRNLQSLLTPYVETGDTLPDNLALAASQAGGAT